MTVPSTSRSTMPTVREILGADTGPTIPSTLLEESPRSLGTEDLNVDRYVSREFLELEYRKLWSRVWQWACTEDEIPEVGDHAVYQIGDRSVLLVRSEADRIQAFYNSCQHRGRLLAGGAGKASSFVCPFHAWAYNLNGTLKSVPCEWDFPQVQANRGQVRAPRDPLRPLRRLRLHQLRRLHRPVGRGAGRHPRALQALPTGAPVRRRQRHEDPSDQLEGRDGGVPRVVPRGRHAHAGAGVHRRRQHPVRHLGEQQPALHPHRGTQPAPGRGGQRGGGLRGGRRRLRPARCGDPAAAGRPDRPRHDREPGSADGRPGGRARPVRPLGHRTHRLHRVLRIPELVPLGRHHAGPAVSIPAQRDGPGQLHLRRQADAAVQPDGPRPPSAPLRKLATEESFTLVPELGLFGPIFDQDFANMAAIQKGMKTHGKAGVTLSEYQESRIRHFHHLLDRWLEL